MKELILIQNELKAPKGQRNNFGKYNYRSCEDILEAVKPLCAKHGCLLTITDELLLIGDRFYIKATATVITADEENRHVDWEHSVSAFAREPESKKGMDVSQITGSASSYARKYALNGLFCIDDTKDADSMDNSTEAQEQAPQPQEKPKQITPASKYQREKLNKYLRAFQDNNDSKAIDYINEALVAPNLTALEATTIISHCKTKLGEK